MSVNNIVSRSGRTRITAATVAVTLAFIMLCAGCGSIDKTADTWASEAALDRSESPGELYKAALDEDILIVYTVTTRVSQTKDAFEAAYPGLFVEIRDLRSPNLIEAVEENYRTGASDCDVVLCNDNSGDFKSRLVDTGIVVPYIPDDIAAHMKDGIDNGMVTFLSEAEILMYDGNRYDSCPIDNIWALTEPEYKGRIYMPNPLRSFSTYALCGSVYDHEVEMADAYRTYTGNELKLADGESVCDVFWRSASENMVFTNSSDEVIEALNNGEADFGIAVSSKLRLKEVGYGMEPVYKLDPFCGSRTTFAVMMAKNSKNINTAKLFIRFLLGEADGTGEGYKPFCTEGTWSARDDVADGNPVKSEDIDLIVPDQDALIARRDQMEKFWTEVIRDSIQSE